MPEGRDQRAGEAPPWQGRADGLPTARWDVGQGGRWSSTGGWGWWAGARASFPAFSRLPPL